jgi:hypothetical protein
VKEVLVLHVWHRSIVLRGVRDQGGRLTGFLHRCGGYTSEPTCWRVSVSLTEAPCGPPKRLDVGV